jgi:hypothetical protein
VSILDEWNYTENAWFGKNRWGVMESDPKIRESFFSRMRGAPGASYVVGSMIMMLDAPVDMAHVYDCQCGMNFSLLYDKWGNHTKCAKAIFAFNRMAKGNRLATECVDDLYLAAGRDGDRATVILSSFECKGSEDEIELVGCRGCSVKVKVIDDYMSEDEALSFVCEDDSARVPVSIRPYTVIVIEVEGLNS